MVINRINELNNFMFTQQSLSTFESCPLKFKKRYIEKLKWGPAMGSAAKRRLEMGNDFHMLARRYFLGIDTGLEELTEEYRELNTWLYNLMEAFKLNTSIKYLPEYRLRVITPNLKLEANFDLLIIKDNSIEIWDWKTHQNTIGINRGVKSIKYSRSYQTMVYMFVLMEQASKLVGREPEYSSISMYYWQPEPPRILGEIKYSREMHEEFERALEAKISYIYTYDYSTFDKSLYSRHCSCCEFNWLCNEQRIDLNAIEGEIDSIME